MPGGEAFEQEPLTGFKLPQPNQAETAQLPIHADIDDGLQQEPSWQEVEAESIREMERRLVPGAVIAMAQQEFDRRKAPPLPELQATPQEARPPRRRGKAA